MRATGQRVPVLYLAPWVDVGGSDKGTIDWFRCLDRDRFAPSLVTTQPSANRRLDEVIPYAEEVWDLPDLMHGNEFARFIATLIHTREIEVLHIMNSRLGFELLPDLAGLPLRPRVVVQLHVEEPDRWGYVRYVSTRYGNLVDAYSVSSQDLRDRLGRYEVPLAKRRLIRTGVDAEREFSPERVKPVGGLDGNLLHILFAARLTPQKDPLLMLDVAARLSAAGQGYRIHVLGDGELAPALRERITASGLQQEVVMHGECVDIAPWYAACDIVLLTSWFEGLPYVAYEAMAMATPIVAPDLAGLRELVTEETGVLISPREDACAYAAAIRALARDPVRRARIGAGGRARVRAEFSLPRMAAEHAILYEELLASPPEAGRAVGQQTRKQAAAGPAPVPALRRRRPRGAPLVSVIVPCFNHGLYLEGCLKSVAEQTYTAIETIVVDDGSSDPETLAALRRIETGGGATLLRMAVNRGPSAARNAALEHARGRYVLPLDADNLLLPHAVAALVKQLRSTGERIGFVYPNYQCFGNRTDYFEPPSYNLSALLAANHCDTSSLIDAEVFDRGFRYPEDVVLGSEDWDFVLALAEHGIYGEAAHGKTLLYRKHGFTRSDLVDAGNVPFAQVVAARHPRLFDPGGRTALKGEWNPAVSVIALDPLVEGIDSAIPSLVSAATAQTCGDFELVIATASEVWPTELGCRLRRVSSLLARSRAEALAGAVQIARGRYALAAYGPPAALLGDPTLIEKALRVLSTNPAVDALAFADAGLSLPAFRLLDAEGVGRAQVGAVCWELIGASAPPAGLELPGCEPLEALLRWLSLQASVQWRQLARRDPGVRAARRDPSAAAIGSPPNRRAQDARVRAQAVPELPDLPAGVAGRIRWPRLWTPPQSRPLCRHVHVASERYLFTNDHEAPPGWRLHYDLGCLRGFPLAGTISLRVRGDAPERGFGLDEEAELDDPELLGFVEQAPMPLFDSLQIGRHRGSGQRVLIAGAEDPLAPMVDELTSIGYIEPYPIHPRHPPHFAVEYGLLGLLRTLDLESRCHRYGAGELPRGRLAGELGALLAAPAGDCEPLWIDQDGRVRGPRCAQLHARPSPRAALRWCVAPLTWRRAGPVVTRLRATTRRTFQSAQILGSRTPALPSRPSTPAGYVLRSATDRTVALYASIHPITGDQLLSNTEAEPHVLGYEDVVLLGHLMARAPVTGRLGIIRPGVPWASRFGLGSG